MLIRSRQLLLPAADQPTPSWGSLSGTPTAELTTDEPVRLPFVDGSNAARIRKEAFNQAIGGTLSFAGDRLEMFGPGNGNILVAAQVALTVALFGNATNYTVENGNVVLTDGVNPVTLGAASTLLTLGPPYAKLGFSPALVPVPVFDLDAATITLSVPLTVTPLGVAYFGIAVLGVTLRTFWNYIKAAA